VKGCESLDSLGRMITILLAVILIVMLPLQYRAEAQVGIMDHIVEAHTHEFTDTIRNEGYISLESYEEYLDKLNQTGEFYDIEIEHASPKTAGEIISEKTKPGMILALNDTRRLPKADGLITSFATHTHTDDCYDGNKHTHTSKSGSCYTYRSHTHTSSCYHSHNGSCYKSCNAFYGTSMSSTNSVHSCGKRLTTYSYTYHCQKGCGTWSLGQRKVCQGCGEISNTRRNAPSGRCTRSKLDCSISTSSPTCGNSGSYDLVCGKTSGAYYKGSTRVYESCNTVVTSIKATQASQTVYTGDNIVTTATATYLDGHTSTVTCTATGYNNMTPGVQTVTLTYSGKVGNAKTTGTRTCTTTVTVKPNITSIAVKPSTQEVKRYQNPSFDVLVYYEDGSSASTSSYEINNFNNHILGRQTVAITYSENGISKSTTAVVKVNNLLKSCPECGNQYELDANDIDQGCPVCTSTVMGIDATPDYISLRQGSDLPISVYALYRNGGRSIVSDWTSDYNPLRIGYQQITISYKGFKDYVTVEVKASKRVCPVCENEYYLNEDGSDPGCPLCHDTVISIVAEPNPVIVGKHQSLDLTVTATFKDGHTEIVNGWSTDLVLDKPGTYNVTVYYKNLTDQITVTIIDDDLLECPYCETSFSRSRYPYGCPACSVTLIGIEANLRYGGTKVIRGTELALEIILKFRDTHREVTYTGYKVSNYQPNILGEQMVTVHYKEFQCNLIIEVIDSMTKKICPNGHEYNINKEDSDPGCPYCMKVNEGEQAILYYDKTYTAQIIETLYSQKIYQLKAGDYITIIVTKKNRSIRSQIMSLFGMDKEENKTITFGGEIFG